MRKIQSKDLDCFSPDPDALMKKLRPITTDEILKRLSFLDYGRDQDAHFTALLKLRDAPVTQWRLDWHPTEVLKLGIGGAPYPNYGGMAVCDKCTDIRLHAFVLCSIFRLLSLEESSALRGYLLQTISRLVIISEKIPELTPSSLASAFSWGMLALPKDEDTVFLALWLIYAVLKDWKSAPNETIECLANWVYSSEVDKSVTQNHINNYFKRDHLHSVWQDIGNYFLERDENDLPKNLHIKIHEIGSFLAH